MSQKPLEDVLREAAKSGRLNYISIAFTQHGWEATYRGVADKDARFVTHEDPACAIRAALTGRAGDAPPPAPKATKPRTTKPAAPAPVEDDILGDLM